MYLTKKDRFYDSGSTLLFLMMNVIYACLYYLYHLNGNQRNHRIQKSTKYISKEKSAKYIFKEKSYMNAQFSNYEYFIRTQIYEAFQQYFIINAQYGHECKGILNYWISPFLNEMYGVIMFVFSYLICGRRVRLRLCCNAKIIYLMNCFSFLLRHLYLNIQIYSDNFLSKYIQNTLKNIHKNMRDLTLEGGTISHQFLTFESPMFAELMKFLLVCKIVVYFWLAFSAKMGISPPPPSDNILQIR